MGVRRTPTRSPSTVAEPLLLIGLTAIVLLVACTNVANLLLARAASRAAEMAVRSSLGAQRGQLLTEAAILAALAGSFSLLVAQGTLVLITSFLPGDLTRNIPFAIDGPVLLFAASLSIATAFLFGVLPTLQATRPDLLSVIKANAGRGSVGRGAARFRSSLVTAQIALSMAVVNEAFVRTFGLGTTALGADARQVQSMVTRQVAVMTAIGGTIGIMAAFLGAAITITAVALTAGYAPARRASRIPPTEALRAE